MSSNNNDSSSSKPKIVEERPTFHGMAIGARAEPSLKIGSLPSALSKPSPTGVLRTALRTKTEGLKSTNSNVPSSSTAWPSQPESLQPLPVIYMLERTHVSIADTPCQEIGRRVVQCLQKESIAASFHPQEAVIDAETNECVQFCIRLWAGKQPGHVLCEVQKVSGCSYLYCQAAKAILAAAKGQAAPKKRSFPIPSSIAKHAAAANNLPAMKDPNAMAKEGIDIASALLQRNRMDARLMAVESLVQMTKTAKHKNYCSRAILCEKQELRSELLKMVECQTESGASDMELENARVLARHALAVLANCLEALEQSGELKSVLSQEQETLCTEKTIAALMSKVEQSADAPHEACQAVRCIGSLVRMSDASKQQCMKLGIAEHLAAAHATGGRWHAHLEQECARLSL